jgi:hypothetical protein
MRRDQILRTAQGRLYPRRLNLVALVALAASGEPRSWSCDSDEVVAAFESYDTNSAN